MGDTAITIILIVVPLIILLLVLFVKQKKLDRRVSEIDYSRVHFGPIIESYEDKMRKLRREQRLESVRYFLSLRWIWQWATTEEREKRKIRKAFNRRITQATKDVGNDNRGN